MHISFTHVWSFFYSDAPLDLKIKSNMVSDLFSLIGRCTMSCQLQNNYKYTFVVHECVCVHSGVTCQDPMVRKQQQSQRNKDVLARPPTRAQVCMWADVCRVYVEFLTHPSSHLKKTSIRPKKYKKKLSSLPILHAQNPFRPICFRINF